MTPGFGCTACGRCCHNLRLPLAVDEVATWIARGGKVELWCDALPDLPGDEDDVARYRRERSFAAKSGSLPIRVNVQLVAAFNGACPHLRADMRCGAYEVRPRTCRIYPAEVLPGTAVDPARKLCPPEAWDGAGPLRFDDETRGAAAGFRMAHAADQQRRVQVVERLGINRAALRNEGQAIHRPAPAELVAAVAAAEAASDPAAAPMEWELVSPRAETRALMADAGARVGAVDAAPTYLELF